LVPGTELAENKTTLESEVSALEKKVAENESKLVGWIGAPIEELANQRANYEVAVKQLQRENEQLKSRLKQQKESLRKAQSEAAAQSQTDESQQLAQQLIQLKKELENLKSSSRVFYNFHAGSRDAWLVQISEGQILAGRAKEKEKPQVFGNSSGFINFVKRLPNDEKYLILVVRPSGIGSFDAIRNALEDSDIDIGVELITEQQVVIDPETGAGSK
jgi:predicted RNase H-like nuclease (RuvC/YqgF family)